MDDYERNLNKVNPYSQNDIWKALLETGAERIKSVPFLGDTITFNEKLYSIREMNNLKNGINFLAQNITTLQEEQKLDLEFIQNNTRDIYFLYKMFLCAIYNQPDEEYIEYLSRYISNCLNRDYSGFTLKLNILNKLSKYTKMHIKILKEIYADCLENMECKKFLGSIDITTEYCVTELQNDGFITQALDNKYSYTWNDISNVHGHKMTNVGIQTLKMINEIE